MILLIDNYDSFVYNLARYVSELGHDPKVVRHDAISLDEIVELQPSHIIISPGPCTPDESGISLALVKKFFTTIPMLGVCLGHQTIAQAFDAKITRALRPLHGKASQITHDQADLFLGLENPLQAARYHSLIVSEENFPNELKITARSREGEIMGLRHRDYPVFGVQFHPESVLTTCGYALLKNFLGTMP